MCGGGLLVRRYDWPMGRTGSNSCWLCPTDNHNYLAARLSIMGGALLPVGGRLDIYTLLFLANDVSISDTRL